jgi:hypothetical protein
MRKWAASLRLGAVLAFVVAAFVFAVPAQGDPTGPTAFYFSATCTGLGSVVLTNAGPSQTAALQVLGKRTIVLLPVNQGIVRRALAEGTTCTFTGFGPSPDDLAPFDPPRPPDPVVIVGSK